MIPVLRPLVSYPVFQLVPWDVLSHSSPAPVARTRHPRLTTLSSLQRRKLTFRNWASLASKCESNLSFRKLAKLKSCN